MGKLIVAFSILWFDIHDWLEPKYSSVKADFCGILAENVIGINIANEIY